MIFLMVLFPPSYLLVTLEDVRVRLCCVKVSVFSDVMFVGFVTLLALDVLFFIIYFICLNVSHEFDLFGLFVGLLMLSF